uniref:Ribosomal protein L18 n=1 Tax=Pterocladiophila hemisphaerica TaxID=2712948 RepID=A0A6M3WWF3_9FLOR|nr:ribosomal protein L18 [Pterocladiophila hemisphaerica]
MIKRKHHFTPFRLCLFTSNKHIYTQLINYKKKTIITGASSLIYTKNYKINYYNTGKISKIIGRDIAIKAFSHNIFHVITSLKKKKYHGNIKSLLKIVRNFGLLC